MRIVRLFQLALVVAGCGDGRLVLGPTSVPPDGGQVAGDGGAGTPADAAVATPDAAAAAPDAGVLDGGLAAADGGAAASDGGGGAASACAAQPVRVVANDNVVNLVADERRVYYATGNTAAAEIWSVSIDGGTPAHIGSWNGRNPISPEKTNLANMAIDATDVFYGNQISIDRIAKDGSGQQHLVTDFFSDEQLAAQCLGVANGYVYWCDDTRRALLREPVDGSAAPFIVVTPVIADGSAFHLAFDETNVYLSYFSSILRIANGSGPSTIATTVVQSSDEGFDIAVYVAVDDARVYFGVGQLLTSLPGAIEAADKRDGAPARILRVTGSLPTRLTADGQHLYWSDDDGLWRMNKDGSGAFTIVRGRRTFVAAGDSVYFVDGTGIWRVCK